jgi:hypothetical protein
MNALQIPNPSPVFAPPDPNAPANPNTPRLTLVPAPEPKPHPTDRARTSTSTPILDYANAADLRRKRSRELSNRLVRLAQWLEPEDRAVAYAAFRDNLTAREVALIRATSARLVRRHLRVLIKRLTTPLFEFVARERDNWPALRRHIATAVVLHGKSHREAAQHLHTTLHIVRTEMNIVQALAGE